MKTFRFIFSPIFMGILFIVLAVSMAAATFIENDFGSSTARALVYNTKWFELIFLLLVANLTGQIFMFRLYRREKITVMLFHLAFIVMIAGAAITRYTGFDGVMGIREGASSSTAYSSENYITFELKNDNGTLVSGYSKPFSAGNLNRYRFNKTLSAYDNELNLKYIGYVPDVKETIMETENGLPCIGLLSTRDMRSGREITLGSGETDRIGDMTIGLDSEADISISSDRDGFSIKSTSGLRATGMTDRMVTIIAADSAVRLAPMTVYTFGDYKVVIQKMTLSGEILIEPAANKMSGTGNGALEFGLTGNAYHNRLYLLYNPEEGSRWTGRAGNITVSVTLGSLEVELPFSIRLNDFIINRYPGSNSPSGFISNVTLSDPEKGDEFTSDIYMNHILKHRGYRFYQSSYDNDEKGTILSVNHDRAGMLTTYTGYGILFLFIVLSLANPRSFFRTVNKGYWVSRLRKPLVVLALLFFSSGVSHAQELILDRAEADKFGAVLAQDQKGRTKPLYTISSDILRKVSKENSFNGLSAMQVFMGYSLDFRHWQDVPVIKVSNAELRKALDMSGDKAAFSDVVSFGPGGGYKLSAFVEDAYSKPEGKRTKFDKEVIKLDERVNICYMMSKGDFLRVFPLKDGTDHWGTAEEALAHVTAREDSLFIMNLLPLWASSVASNTRPEVAPSEYRESLINYQRINSGYELPSPGKVKAELLYYKVSIFEKLFPFYATLGLLMIMVLLAGIISGRKKASLVMKILIGLAIAGYLFHTAGLGLRWVISGHSPMSNGYESLLFVSWVTMLAGFIFSRKSLFPLAATTLLAGMTLMVAHLSFMDPEITNLVPVLKSYLLTLHVSVIIGSYGFLGLGAILGLMVMIMILFSNRNNMENISSTIDELTVINYQTLTLGLYFLTIGTFLGAVWANESWGRYWGWDPKETWSLITIVVYTLVTHSRLIPGMKDTFTFNVISLFAFSSVLMTYFGVNYYLSGLHSYAAGDPVPVPVFVYITVLLLVSVAVSAGLKYRNYRISEGKN